MNTTKTDTPETDGWAGDCGNAYSIQFNGKATSELVPADLARKLERERDAALRELAELRADKERLDWLEKRPVYMENFTRQAIDAAKEAK